MYILWIYDLFTTRAYTFNDMSALIEFIDNNVVNNSYCKIEKVGKKK